MNEEIYSSDDEFYIEEFQSDISDSDSSIIEVNTRKRKTVPLNDSDEDSDEDNYSMNWENVSSDNEEIPRRIPFFIGNRSVRPQIRTNIVEPFEVFKSFFTDELIENIVQQTNSCANLKINEKELSKYSTWNNWKNVTSDEMKAFLGVILNMGLIPLGNIEEYWSQEFCAEIPWFGKIFKRQRFLQIFWMLHLNENVVQNPDLRTRVQKVSNFLEYLDGKFREHFIPGMEISIDEAVVGYKVRILFITYNPMKPTKWEIRIYVLADSKTGYIYAILPYYGKITSDSLIKPEFPVSTRIVLHLCNKLLQA